MSQADETSITRRPTKSTNQTARRAGDAATIALMLLKAGLGLAGGAAPVTTPKQPVLSGGAMAEVL